LQGGAGYRYYRLDDMLTVFCSLIETNTARDDRDRRND
jgi:hypothetical protein